MKRFLVALIALASVTALSGCVAPNVVYHSNAALPAPLHPQLTFLKPDAVVSLRTAGGMLEPRADWSEAATNALSEAVRGHLFDAGLDFTDAPEGTAEDEYAIRQSINLILDAVELAMVKGVIGDARSYALDKAQRERVAGATGADYALALTYRADRASAGRMTAGFLAAFAGVAIEMDTARFRSALIDLRDGHIKWANFDASDKVQAPVHVNPDVNNRKQWRRAVNILMSEFPL